MEMSHGHRVTSRHDPYVKKANVFADNFAEATLPNNHLVDWLPFRQQTLRNRLSRVGAELFFSSGAFAFFPPWHGFQEQGTRMA